MLYHFYNIEIFGMKDFSSYRLHKWMCSVTNFVLYEGLCFAALCKHYRYLQ